MPKDNPFERGTRDYEDWLKSYIALNKNELATKYRNMQEDAFEFLRASFYRWAKIWQTQAKKLDLDGAPEVLGVGDLHLENFGTWRDVDGRLAWGVNDFDEACPVPYINDLVRLAVSTDLALSSKRTAKTFHASVTPESAFDAILEGYTRGITRAAKQPDARRPYVLAEDHGWLRTIVVNKLELRDENGKTKFDKIVDDLAPNKLPSLQFAVPPTAREALYGAFPTPVLSHYRVGQRVAGLGSLGRQRFTAIVDDWNGGLVAREAKALAPSAWLWATGHPRAHEIWYETALREAIRARDPWIRIYQGWVVRRLAPDAGKVKLDDMPPELDDKLLFAMGCETANVHSWSHVPLSAVAEDLQRRQQRGVKKGDWFHKAVARMKEATLQDWEHCKKAHLDK